MQSPGAKIFNMKQILQIKTNFISCRLFVLFVVLAIGSACSPEVTEHPLILPAGAEPSAKLHNDRGLDYFGRGDYGEAVIYFLQAKAADPHAGEIYFNIGLCRHLMGDGDKARQSFQKAKQYARNNRKILDSPLFHQYITPG